MVCTAPYCGASRRNLAFACNAALRAAKLRFAQPMLLRSMHASAEIAVNCRKLGDFVVVIEVRPKKCVRSVWDQIRKTTVVV